MADKENFPKVAVRTRTRKKIVILAALQDRPIADLLGEMVDAIWQQASIEGYVNERMLGDVKLTPEGEGETGGNTPAIEAGVSYVQKIQE